MAVSRWKVLEHLVATVLLLGFLTSWNGRCACVSAQSGLLASTTRLKGFADLDLTSGLSKYIRHETTRLGIINTSKGYEDEVPIVVERLKILGRLSADLEAQKVQKEALLKTLTDYHPTSALRVISLFLQDWEDKLQNHTAFGFRFAEFLSNNDDSKLPNKTDLTVAAKAVAEIQFIYNLSTSDLYTGEVMGYKGLALRPKEAFEVGVVLLELRHLKQAASWFQAALKDTPEAEMTFEGAKKASYPVAKAMAHLGVLKYGMDEKGEGLKLLEKASDIAPDDDNIRRQYLSRRFGRDVEPLVYSQPDPVALQWFRLCAKNTSVDKVWSGQTRRHHVCRYKTSRLAPYKVYREEILSRSPFLSLVYGLLGAAEAAAVVNVSADKLVDKPVDGAETYLYLVQGAQLNSKVHIAKLISSRITDITGLDLTEVSASKPVDAWEPARYPSAEPLHVLNYGISGSFLPHFDLGREYGFKHPMRLSGHRMATVLIYLTNVSAGGATAFPHLNVSVTPVAGNALLWYNTSPAGEAEAGLLHGGCPVAVGSKWGRARLRPDNTATTVRHATGTLGKG